MVPRQGRQRKRSGSVVGLLAVALVTARRPVSAQLTTLFGSAGLDYQYQAQTSDGETASVDALRQQYTLGVDGRILDPRLATFRASGALLFGTTRDENSRTASFDGSLSLLQGKPYSLTLRHSRSSSAEAGGADLTSYGANLRLTFPDKPQVFLDFDRRHVVTRSSGPSDLAFTTGSVRVLQRLQRGTVEGELGIQSFKDAIRGTSTDRKFGRLSQALTFGAATSLRLTVDGFSQDAQSSISSAFSLLNRPSANYSRGLNLGFRLRRSGGQVIRSMETGGALSRTFAFRALPWLSLNASTSAVGVFADPAGDIVAMTGGGRMVATLRQVIALADYALEIVEHGGGNRDGPERSVGFGHRIHLGLASRSLDPLRVSGDWFFTRQETPTETVRNFVIARAEVAPTPRLLVRSFAELLSERIRLAGPTPIDSELRLASVGTGAYVRATRGLLLDLAATMNWRETRTTSDKTSLTSVGASWPLPGRGRPTLNIRVLKERSSAEGPDRLEARTRLGLRLGQLNLMMEHLFEERQIQGATVRSNTLLVSLVRTFTRGF